MKASREYNIQKRNITGVPAKKTGLFTLALFFLTLFSLSAFSVQQLMNLHGRVTNSGAIMSSGDIRVLIYDASTGGNVVYDSNTEFNSRIIDSTFDLMLGTNVNLDLNYGTTYYMDINVNTTNLDINGNDRQAFEAGRGLILTGSIPADTIVNADINSSTTIDWTKISKTGADLNEFAWSSDFNNAYARKTATETITNNLNFHNIVTWSDGFDKSGVTINNGNVYTQNLVIVNDFNVTTTASVDRNSHQQPTINNTWDFGGNTKRWRVMYLTDSNATTASIGTLTLANTLGVGSGGTGSTSFTTGRVPFSNGTILTQDGNLFWDNTNKRLGLGSTSPGHTLHVFGDINGTANAYLGNIRVITNDININNVNARDANITFNNNSGTEIMRVVSGGNVGIRATNPTQKLDVNGNTRISGDLNFTGSGYLGSIFTKGTDINLNTINSRDGNITFVNTLGTELIRLVGSSGNVGFSVTNPTYKVDANGGMRVIGNLNVTGTTYATATLSGIVTDTVFNAAFPVADGNIPNDIVVNYVRGAVFNAAFPVNLDNNTTGTLPKASGGTNATDYNSGGIIFYDGTRFFTDTNLYWDATNKRLGIAGPTSPQNKLNLVGDLNVVTSLTATPSLYIRSTDGNVGINTNNPLTTFNVIGDVNFSTSTTNVALYIRNTDGNIGIGTASPGKTLTIIGDINITDKLYGGGVASSQWTTVGNTIYFTGVTGNDGNVGIGTATPQFKLDVNGDVRANAYRDALGWVPNQAATDRVVFGLNNGFGSGATPAISMYRSYDFNFFDTTTVHANSKGYRGAISDGRYIYFIPDNGNTSGLVMRYDTTGALDNNASWSDYNLLGVHTAAEGFFGAAFDGQYIYFAPNRNNASGVMLRYDTNRQFDINSSWATKDITQVHADAKGFQGAIFDGKFVYFVPYNSGSGSVLMRFDTNQGLDTNSAWLAKDLTQTHAGAKGFFGGAYDGRFIYLVPNYDGTNYHGIVVRYDTSQGFDANASYDTFDTTFIHANAKGYRGAIYDGRFIYFIPYQTTASALSGTIVRFDTDGNFNANSQPPLDINASWDAVDITLFSSNARGYVGAAYDGRFIYLAPNNNNTSGTIMRFDTFGAMDDNASWLDYNVLSLNTSLQGFFGAAFDGRYVYLVPNNNNTSGTVARVRAWPGGVDTGSLNKAARSSDFYMSAKGNVGIGTIFATHKITVAGDLNVVTGDVNANSPNSPVAALKRRPKLYVSNTTGYIGINNDNPQTLLDVNGDVAASAWRDGIGWVSNQAMNDKLAFGINNGGFGGGATPAITQPRAYDFNYFTLSKLKPDLNGFRGAVFDGRFVYFVPFSNGTSHGVVLRYDTVAPLDENTAWTDFNMQTVHQNARAYTGGVFDGEYVYFIPSANGTTASSVAMRYDTNMAFDDNSAWRALDIARQNPSAYSFIGGVFDGQFVYYIPDQNTASTSSGVWVRYDTNRQFDINKSWHDVNLTAVHADARGFAGGAFDGRFIYLVPSNNGSTHGIFMRYDTTKAFDSNAAYSVFDVNKVNNNARGFAGAVYDGRFVYLVPSNNGSDSGLMVRFDTATDLNSSQAKRIDDNRFWSVKDLTLINTNAKGFYGGFFDGRFVHLIPNSTTAGSAKGLMIRYDTTQPFDANGSWYTYDTQLVNTNSQGFVGGAFDGRFFYFSPSSIADGVVTRMRAWAGGLDSAAQSIYRVAKTIDFFIDGNGNVGLGTVIPYGKLNVVGGDVNITTLSTNGAIYSNLGLLTNVAPSSRQYKENIKPIDLNAERVLKLEPKSFTWKNNKQKDFGYIAEEVREIIPEIYQNDNKTKGYDISKLPFYIIELLKKASSEDEATAQKISKRQSLIDEKWSTIEELRRGICDLNKDEQICRGQFTQ